MYNHFLRRKAFCFETSYHSMNNEWWDLRPVCSTAQTQQCYPRLNLVDRLTFGISVLRYSLRASSSSCAFLACSTFSLSSWAFCWRSSRCWKRPRSSTRRSVWKLNGFTTVGLKSCGGAEEERNNPLFYMGSLTTSPNSQPQNLNHSGKQMPTNWGGRVQFSN